MNVSLLKNQYITAFSKKWGLFFTLGLAMMLLGIVAISASTLTTLLTVIFLGYLLMLGGVVVIIDAITFWRHKPSGFFIHLLLGLIYLAVGVMLTYNPLSGSMSLTLLIGIFYLVVGAFRLVYSLNMRLPKWGYGFVNALISLLLGVLILASWPQSSLYIIGLFVGIDLFLTGCVYMIMSLAGRSRAKVSNH